MKAELRITLPWLALVLRIHINGPIVRIDTKTIHSVGGGTPTPNSSPRHLRQSRCRRLPRSRVPVVAHLGGPTRRPAATAKDGRHRETVYGFPNT